MNTSEWSEHAQAIDSAQLKKQMQELNATSQAVKESIVDSVMTLVSTSKPYLLDTDGLLDAYVPYIADNLKMAIPGLRVSAFMPDHRSNHIDFRITTTGCKEITIPFIRRNYMCGKNTTERAHHVLLDLGRIVLGISEETMMSIVASTQKEQAGTRQEKPPLGLMPRRQWLEPRAVDILKAMQRYIEAGKAVPHDWSVELHHITEELKDAIRE